MYGRLMTINVFVFSIMFGAFPAWASQDAPDSSSMTLADQCPAAAKWRKARSEQTDPYSEDKTQWTKPLLRKQLAKRVAADQKARNGAVDSENRLIPSKVKAILAVDADNLTWFKSVIEEHGFPTAAEVGKEGVHHAWLLLQHADSDQNFQATMLKKLESRVGTGGILKSDYALLVDRVRINQGKKQLYGSQIGVKDGSYVVLPTVDMAHVDERREQMGLMPVSYNLCKIRFRYGSLSDAKSE